MRSLDHPNIIKYYETYEDVKYIYLVMEHFLDVRESFRSINEKKGFESALKALNVCHL